MDIKEAIRNIAKGGAWALPCRVLQVDKTNAVCDLEPVSGDAIIYNARLRAAADAAQFAGVVCFPKVGSTVLALLPDAATAFVCAVTEIESVLIDVEGLFKAGLNADGTLAIDAPKITVNGGTLGALVVLPLLQAELNKIAAWQQAFVVAIQAAVPVPADGGAAIKAALVAAMTGLPLPDGSALGNEKIVQ